MTLRGNALLNLLRRAHLIEIEALCAELDNQSIRAFIDVLPSGPVSHDASIRRMPTAILSPHRAAAADEGRQMIGDMIVVDLKAKIAGTKVRQLIQAIQNTIMSLFIAVSDGRKLHLGAKARNVQSATQVQSLSLPCLTAVNG